MVALVLGVSRWLRGDTVPTADVPAVGWVDQQEEESPEETTDDAEPLRGEPATNEPVPIEETESEAPTTFNLALPFTSQAPFGVWDAVHEETCEEASVSMVAGYFEGMPQGNMDPSTADAVMLDMVAYQEANGYGVSVSVAELQSIIDVYYDGAYVVEIIDDPTADDIRQLIADGYPVIAPAAGRMLGNPFFTGEGPLYHMLVIRGYTDGAFITNDPGTRHGENYTYDADVLMNALHDWNDGDPVNGAKRVLVMRPVLGL